jgi:hypothetical protein
MHNGKAKLIDVRVGDYVRLTEFGKNHQRYREFGSLSRKVNRVYPCTCSYQDGCCNAKIWVEGFVGDYDSGCHGYGKENGLTLELVPKNEGR